jgi:nucleoside-diphosphate-sugar epimerase
VTRTVALTGATGFIGWHVARRFQLSGWRVQALVRPESRRPVPDGVERISAPLHEADVISACKGASLLVHMAGAVGHHSTDEFVRTNVNATGEVARAARALGIRLVHTSSLGATGPYPPDDPPTEDSPLTPINAYGESKRRSEEVIRSVDRLEWAIVRPTLVYGPRDRLFHPVFKMSRHGLFPVPNAHAVYNVVHVDDVARGIEMVGTAPVTSEVFFIGHPQPIAVVDLLAHLASVFGRRFRPLTISPVALRAMAEVGSLLSYVGIRAPIDRDRLKEITADGFVCRTDKARDRLGFVATTELRQGLASTAEWYAQNGWLPTQR